MVAFGMIDNKAFNGDVKTNPFKFHHQDESSISLYREGVTVTFRPFITNFTKGKCGRKYNAGLMQGLELYNRDENIGITLQDFTDGGYTLFAFNPTPDLTIARHAQPYHESNLRF